METGSSVKSAKPSKLPAATRRAWILKAVGWSGQPEQEQGLLRIVITFAILLYVITNWPASDTGKEIWAAGFRVTSIFFAYSVLLFCATLVWPRPSTPRRIGSIVLDIGTMSYGLHLTGAVGAPWYGVFLWVTLGNGFRYGEKFLYLSGAVSFVGFAALAATTPFWTENSDLAIGLAATLLVIPAYSALLIRRLNQARLRADEANRAKSEFLSRMSHEIRTPLNGILGMTELLRERPLEADDRECVETIYASGQTLAYQIDEILDLSKIEAGHMSLERLQFDLYALINTTLRIFDSQIDNRQLQLQETIDPKTPFLLNGDPHKLRQIIINLVGNAVKFTEHGFVSLRVYPRRLEADQVVLRFEVADTGTGIASDRLQLIFEPFAQADSGVARQFGGTGLGTTICKRLVELMGGRIGVHSTPHVGTTFWFDLPFEVGIAKASGANHAWTRECSLLYLRPAACADKGITATLKEWHMPFKTIETISEALKLLRDRADSNAPFDALVIENMPYDSELESLLRRLETTHAPGSPHLVLIGSTNYPPEIAGRTHDRLFVLQSPVDKRVLFNTLHACYSRHSTEDDVIHIARHQARGKQSSKALNILVGDDNATNRLVLHRMLENMGYRCTAVTCGEAVLTALEHSRFDAVIVDKNMPDMSGLDVFRTYAMAHGGAPAVKFIVLTADATAQARDACVSAGIEYFLTKPVSLSRLQETLAEVVSASRTQEQASSSPADEPPATVDTDKLPVVDDNEVEKLSLLAGTDPDFLSDIVANFETDAGQDIRGLEIAVANRDWAAFQEYAHALKGAAMYLGLSRLVALSLAAQRLSEHEFERAGIEQVRALRQATDAALKALQEKIQSPRKMGLS